MYDESEPIRNMRAERKQALRVMLWTRDRGVCAICLNPCEPNRGANIDHIIPLARGGTNHPINLGLTHTACNKAKHDRILRVPRLACAETLYRITHNGAELAFIASSVRSIPGIPHNNYPKGT